MSRRGRWTHEDQRGCAEAAGRASPIRPQLVLKNRDGLVLPVTQDDGPDVADPGPLTRREQDQKGRRRPPLRIRVPPELISYELKSVIKRAEARARHGPQAKKVR